MERGPDYAVGVGEKSSEPAIQKAREADKFSYYVRGDSQIPSNPLRELDELYAKDNKVPQIDLETFADEHVKSMEESKFNEDMTLLQQELDNLEPGKYTAAFMQNSTPMDPPSAPFQALLEEGIFGLFFAKGTICVACPVFPRPRVEVRLGMLPGVGTLPYGYTGPFPTRRLNSSAPSKR